MSVEGWPTSVPGWELGEVRGSAARVHGQEWGRAAVRSATVVHVEQAALVLGSTQPESHADPAALAQSGVALARRRSGGGAVLVRPRDPLWVDVIIPRDDPLWEDDVGVAFHWLGRAWAAALGDLGVDAVVHEGPLVTTPWSRLVCFAGLGPGEVTVDGAKMVGIAQRRSRIGARFQCAVLARWEPAAITSLLALDEHTRNEADAALAHVATGLDVPPESVLDALAAHLPG